MREGKNLALAVLLGFLTTQSCRHYIEKARFTPKTRDVITADPNARDQNDTYVEINGRRYYGVVDGEPIERYFERKR